MEFIFQLGSFITSYARELTIRTSQKIMDYSLEHYGKDLYIYSDTDSIKTILPLEDVKKFCNIDDFELGAWANEGLAQKGKFIRQKTYLEEIDGKMKITCSGLSPKFYDNVKWETFKTGFSCTGKLMFKHVKGGVKLVETDFTIKERKVKNNIANFGKK